MTTVRIDGETFHVAGRRDRLAFAAELQRCGATQSTRAFEQWRAARRTTNAFLVLSLTSGLVVAGIPVPAAPAVSLVAAIDAGNKRRAMVRYLQVELEEAQARLDASDALLDSLPEMADISDNPDNHRSE